MRVCQSFEQNNHDTHKSSQYLQGLSNTLWTRFITLSNFVSSVALRKCTLLWWGPGGDRRIAASISIILLAMRCAILEFNSGERTLRPGWSPYLWPSWHQRAFKFASLFFMYLWIYFCTLRFSKHIPATKHIQFKKIENLVKYFEKWRFTKNKTIIVYCCGCRRCRCCRRCRVCCWLLVLVWLSVGGWFKLV